MTDYLKLTAYFGERLRCDDRFVSDAILDLYGHNAVATSVVLRGIASFGPHHVLHTDQSLSMSEDSPIVVAAVDTAEKMAGLGDRVAAMVPRGLVTLERAHLGGSIRPADTAKLTVYVGRQDRADGRPAYRSVCELLHTTGFDGASVFLGVDGTVRGERKRARFFGRNLGVPVMIIAVGSGEQVSAVLPQLENLLREPIFTVERAQVCKRDGELLTHPYAFPAADDHGRALWQKLMIYTSEAALHDGAPIHRAIVARLRHSKTTCGATVLRGIWGFDGEREPHGDKWIQLGRQVPVTTIVVDAPERIAASFEIINELTREHGLVTSELVPASVSIDGEDRRGGTGLAQYDY